MTRRKILVLSFLIFLLVLLALPAGWFGIFLVRPVAPSSPRVLTVPAGAPLSRVAELLSEQGVIGSPSAFKWLARLRHAATRIKAGEYSFSGGAVPGEVLGRLVAGDVVRRRFTIVEGMTLKEIAQRLAEAGFGSAGDYFSLSRDPAFLGELGIEAPSLEGYLFPETYAVVADTPPRRLIEVMVEQFRKRVTPELIEGARRNGLDLHQLVTLASVVQKEAGNAEEMPLIAGVFHNRLKRRIPLQADPTVIYGVKDFKGNLTRKHLSTPTPYNTYRMLGLPPTPIASPGEQALRAAAFPATTDNLFFVARGDGTHVFSSTLREHNRNVRHYQLHR